jgi:signal transduction histidine kinase
MNQEVVPLYAGTATISIDDEESIAQMLPLRRDAEELARSLYKDATQLADRTRVEIRDLIARNASSFASSRTVFIGVAAGAIVLALLLGFVLSWSVIGPIQSIGGRLAAIASGDFSGRVEVENRDELGALGANVNRMNDELRRLYTELEAASRHKSEFLANMSHELRTPLNAIIGFSEVLNERMFGELNDKQAEYLKDIHASGQHLLSLINDILDLSKIEAGRMELELTHFDLPQAIDNALTLVRERAGRRGIALHQAVDEGLGEVTGDERKIKQVLLNLLSNALKFTPEGGRIDVRGRTADGMAEISVTDTGIGIAAEHYDAVFEEFRQVGEADKKAEGTGLGLALCRKFVELHGGQIWVKSQIGLGSTFAFTLPLDSSP